MKNMKKWFVLLVIFILVGCNNGKNDFMTTNSKEKYQEQQQEIEQILKEDQHIKRVTTVITKDAAIVGIEVKPFSKWNKQKYEKKWEKEIKKALPERNVVVSTDLKLIMETDKLAKKQLSEKKLNKKIKELKKLKKEQT